VITPAYLPFFQRLEKNATVLQVIEILLQAIDSGHVCLALSTLSRLISIEQTVLQHLLSQSILVGKAGEFTPFIVDQNRVYLARLWFEETQVAQLLCQKIQPIPVDIATAKPVLDILFPSSLTPDWQKVAAALAILHRLTIISGGPGTGKTTTLTRLLIALLATQTPPLVIHLAAPTGKAAARMQTAIQQAKQLIPEQFTPLLKYIPDVASTLHRLLHLSPLQHQAKQTPLHVDILVVDEASMIDLPMMNMVLQRLPKSAQLILLGDQNQLASVEPGAVFASLCEGQGYSCQVHQTLSQLTGFALPVYTPHSRLSNAVVHLEHSYRFSAGGKIGALARAIHQGEVEAALTLLLQGEEVMWLQDKELAYAKMQAGYQAYFKAAQDPTVSISTVFTLWDQFQVLTPLREGPQGSIALNQKVSQMLAGSMVHKQTWYSGRAIMITENSPGIGLYNGDIGIVREDRGEIGVYFTPDGKNIRRFTPSRLPQYESAFVMTVHKSQGSEFDEILCYVPDMFTPVMTRTLLYTAVTRARRQVTLYGQPQTLERMLMHTEQRESGLADRLRLPQKLKGEQLRLFDD
jgi:exodeoxyribonuclease V alpha subunit